MRRVVVIGVGGSGKSTLSRQMGELTGLPVVHLDGLYWKPGWVEPTLASWRATVRELVSHDSWILDGNYGGTIDIRLAAADMVVFLDLPPWVTLPRVFRRWLTHRGRVRPGMAPGCNERFSWKFLLWILRFRRDRRPAILQKLKQLPPSTEVVMLGSSREVAAFLHDLRDRQGEHNGPVMCS